MVGDSSTVVGFGLRSQYPGGRLMEALAGLAPRLQAADLAIGNLECPLTTVGIGGSSWARDQMRGDPEYARVLRDSGFNAVSVANNHSVQHGDAGFAATVAALREHGIAVLGLRGSSPWHARPETFTHSTGSTVALLAYSWRPRQYGSGPPPYAEFLPDAALADVTRARGSHDNVIVSLHWGEEFVPQPSLEEVSFARALAAGGADLIIGHHPHVVRPVERWERSIIAYSLGNAVTDMIWMEPLRQGLLLEATLGSDSPAADLSELRIDDSYHTYLTGTAPREPAVGVLPHTAASYHAASKRGIRAQRAAAYRYTAWNLHRFPPRVLAPLVWTTIRNKVHAMFPWGGVGTP